MSATMPSMDCQARDGRGERCRVVGEHQTARNTRGEVCLMHQTTHSVWLAP